MFVSRLKMAALAAVFAAFFAAPAAAQEPYNDPSFDGTAYEEAAPQSDEGVSFEGATGDASQMPPEGVSASELGGTFSGMTGQNPAVPARPAPQDSVPPSLPAAFDTVVPPISPPAAAQNTADQDMPAFDDPCAAYGDGDAYNMCQDRIKKIERMRDAKNRRMGVDTTPAIVPTEKAVKTDSAKDPAKAAVDKVEELEKKLKEKEAADAAKKAAPTTKKGIGDFDRNPAKGNALFK